MIRKRVKITAIILVQMLLALNTAWAGTNDLSPQVCVDKASFAEWFRDFCLIQEKMNSSPDHTRKLMKRLRLKGRPESDKLYKLAERDLSQGLKSLNLRSGNIKRYIQEEIARECLTLRAGEKFLRRRLRSIFVEAVIREIGWKKFVKLDALKLMFAARNIFSKSSMSGVESLGLRKQISRDATFYYNRKIATLEFRISGERMRVFQSGGNADVFNLGATVLRVRPQAGTAPDIKSAEKTLIALSRAKIIAPVMAIILSPKETAGNTMP